MGSGLKSNWTLEDAGIPGPNFLRESLTSCTDPLKAIEEFQNDNGILLMSLRPMLPLLDLHGIRRLDFHNSVLENLREKLIEQIDKIGSQLNGRKSDENQRRDKESRLKKDRFRDRDSMKTATGTAANTSADKQEKILRELLVKSFPLIRVKSLRPVIMCILKNMSRIDDKYLKFLVRDDELYDEIDTEVKRQIWEDNSSLFGDEVSPLLSNYIWHKEVFLHDHLNVCGDFFAQSPKSRRENEIVQKLIHMIGKSVTLYDMVLQFLRTLFFRTRNNHYCTLRVEILMAYHDKEIQDIFGVDPCHKFTWCMDACIREKNVDVKKIKELQILFDSINKTDNDQLMLEFSVVLCDPYAINFVAGYTIKMLQHTINNDGLPRENPTLILLLRMLSLGLNASKLFGTRSGYTEPRLDVHLLTKFLPALMSVMVDDQVRRLNAKLPPDEREAAIMVIEHAGPLPEICEQFAKDNLIASVLLMYYTLNVVRQKDQTAICRAIPALAFCAELHSFEDPFLHTLVNGLIALQDEFASESFCTAVFDQFFFVRLTHNNVIVKHVLKLIWYVHGRLPAHRLETLMKSLEPGNQHNDNTHSLYRKLQRRIENYNLQTEQTFGAGGAAAATANSSSAGNSSGFLAGNNDDDFESPLIGLPTPTHY